MVALTNENSLLLERLQGLSQQVQSLTEQGSNLNASISGEESIEQVRIQTI